MAFPYTPVLDTFNRANEGPPPSSSWTSVGAGLKVVSNTCRPNAVGASGGAWTTALGVEDQEAYVTITTLPSDLGLTLLYARLDGVLGKYYAVRHWYSATTDDYIDIARADGSSLTTPISSVFQNLSAGDGLGIRCQGSTIEAWIKTSGTWSIACSAVDSTYSGASPNNYIGMFNVEASGPSAVYDNFGGGSVILGEVASPFTFNFNTDSNRANKVFLPVEADTLTFTPA